MRFTTEDTEVHRGAVFVSAACGVLFVVCHPDPRSGRDLLFRLSSRKQIPRVYALRNDNFILSSLCTSVSSVVKILIACRSHSASSCSVLTAQCCGGGLPHHGGWHCRTAALRSVGGAKLAVVDCGAFLPCPLGVSEAAEEDRGGQSRTCDGLKARLRPCDGAFSKIPKRSEGSI